MGMRDEGVTRTRVGARLPQCNSPLLLPHPQLPYLPALLSTPLFPTPPPPHLQFPPGRLAPHPPLVRISLGGCLGHAHHAVQGEERGDVQAGDGAGARLGDALRG